MIVKLSHHQARTVARRVSAFHGDAMRAHRSKRGRRAHDYDLPAIAWRQILDEMLRVCYGPAGGKLDRGVPSSAYTAVREIAGLLQQYERHPALREAAVEGHVGGVLPVWELGDDSAFVWSIYPTTGRFAILWPMHLTISGLAATSWAPLDRPTPESWTMRPETHVTFIGRPVVSESELGPDELEDVPDVPNRMDGPRRSS